MTSLQDYIDIIALLWPALATAAAVMFAGALVGTFVQLRREGMAALALPQVVAVGAALGMRLTWPPLAPAIGVAAVAVILLAWSRRQRASHWLLPCLFVAGLSISFLIIANSGEHVAELQALFTGIDISVSANQAALAIPVIVITGLICALLWRRWLLMAQAPAVAELAGMNPGRWDVLFLCLLAIVLLFGTNAIGMLLVLAALFLPAATVLPWIRRVPTALIVAPVVGVLALAIGLVLSIENAWPLSQSVGGVGFTALLASYGLRSALRHTA